MFNGPMHKFCENKFFDSNSLNNFSFLTLKKIVSYQIFRFRIFNSVDHFVLLQSLFNHGSGLQDRFCKTCTTTTTSLDSSENRIIIFNVFDVQ